jgi:hypothetical protein
MADEDLKVEDDKAPEGADEVVENKDDDSVTVSVSEDGDPGIDPEVGIEEMKRNLAMAQKQMAEERQKRIEMERAANQSKAEVHNAQLRAAHSEYNSIRDSISFLKSHEAHLIEEWKDAKTMGDYTREAELQRQWYQVQDNMRQLDQRRVGYENFFKNPPQPVQPQARDALEEWAAQQSPRTADWALRNRDHLETESQKNRVAAAHYKALAEGYQPDTDAYFKMIENEIGIRKPSRAANEVEDEETPMSAAAAPKRSVSPPPAPVSRGGTRKGAVTLSQAEREA